MVKEKGNRVRLPEVVLFLVFQVCTERGEWFVVVVSDVAHFEGALDSTGDEAGTPDTLRLSVAFAFATLAIFAVIAGLHHDWLKGSHLVFTLLMRLVLPALRGSGFGYLLTYARTALICSLRLRASNAAWP